ncbi:MAG TPA: hypothetical protein VGA21_14715 [Cyclobacteriaceae bacterium]|jgi:hypothetical protein
MQTNKFCYRPDKIPALQQPENSRFFPENLRPMGLVVYQNTLGGKHSKELHPFPITKLAGNCSFPNFGLFFYPLSQFIFAFTYPCLAN